MTHSLGELDVYPRRSFPAGGTRGSGETSPHGACCPGLGEGRQSRIGASLTHWVRSVFVSVMQGRASASLCSQILGFS